MRKLLTVFIVFLFAFNLPAQDFFDDDADKAWAEETTSIDEWQAEERFHEEWRGFDDEDVKINIFENEVKQEESVKEKGPLVIPKRVFELGLLELDVGVAQNFKTNILDYLQKKLVLDFANFSTDFNIGIDLFLRPIYWNVNIKNDWGFGMDIGKVTVYGNVSLPNDLFHLKKSSGSSFGVGAAVFADVGIPVFFSIKNVWEDRKLRINVRPAGFVTAAYVEPKMKYKLVDVNKDGMHGSYIEVDYGFRAYTPFSLEDPGKIMDTLDVGSALGIDFSLGADYPLFEWIDVGVQFINIPLSPSRLRHYIELEGKAFGDSSTITIDDLIDNNFSNISFSIPEEFEFKYGEVSGNAVAPFFRPFKMLLTADFYPLYFLKQLPNRYLILSPVLGFSINTLFVQPAAIEVGLKVSTDLANMFVPSISIFYEDQMWKNAFDFAFNLRAFQLNLGVSMQSQDFVKSWTGAGLRFIFGMIFGW